MAPPSPVIDPADRLSKLPLEIMAQILSFLPAQDAVRTCILGRTWRDAWKFTRRLLITTKSVQEDRRFVDRLLRVRLDGLEVASLDASEISFDASEAVEDDEEYIGSILSSEIGFDASETVEDDEEYIGSLLNSEDMPIINRWIRRVLKCQIQMLRIDIKTCHNEGHLEMRDMPLLISGHLTRLELTGVWFFHHCLNLDGCPALEHLEINRCFFLGVRKITSLSLKHLVITNSDSNEDEKRIQICVPRLVSLLLDSVDVRTPLLERMPGLVSAKVRIDTYLDYCGCEDPMVCYHVMGAGNTSDIDSDSNDEEGSGDYAGQNATKCVVLEGLAQAKDLELIASDKTYIFRRDLRWCPTFSKLKTLVLIEVYSRADCSALACMLEHAPLLEKLTLILHTVPQGRGKYKVEMKGYPDAKVKSTKISQHLQMVKINCENVNETFLCILNFLGALNISFDIRVTTK